MVFMVETSVFNISTLLEHTGNAIIPEDDECLTNALISTLLSF